MVLVLVVVLIAAAVLAASVGAVVIPLGEVLASTVRKIGLSDDPTGRTDAVLWGIRLPRIVLGALSGAALGVAGAVYQGVFRNPIADPQLLGVGPGAALAAAVGAGAGDPNAALAAGTIGGIFTALAIRRLGRRLAEADETRLVLVGVALGAALSAWLGFVVFGSDRARVPPVEFWLLGSLTGSTWRAASVVGVIVVGGVVVLSLSWRTLDLLVLGRKEARHLGVDTAFTTTMLMIATGGMVGATVGAAGMIGFVGLLAPHVVRPATGPGNRHLVPASALAGASFVVLADVAARTLLSPIEIPVGLLTSAVGGPFFLWLIARKAGRR